MQVSTILAGKGRDVATARPQTPMMTIIEGLAEKNIGAIVLTDDADGVAGIVSERDVVRALARHGASVLDQPVSDHMTRSVVTCSEADTAHDLMSKMTNGRFRHLPVVTNNRMVGVISIGDIVKERIAEVQREADALRDYIASS